jgi:hypothetical protein
VDSLSDIKPEGFSAFEQLPRDMTEARTQEMRISQATSLTDLAPDFAFFTTALFHTHAKLDRDPIQEFVNRSDKKITVGTIYSPTPIFSGLQIGKDSNWNHALFVIARQEWKACFKFLAGTGIQDTPNKIIYRALPHDLAIVDFLQMRDEAILPSPLPMVDVMVFGVDGNRRKVILQPALRPPLDQPYARSLKPDPETVEYGRKLFRGENPLDTPFSYPKR